MTPNEKADDIMRRCWWRQEQHPGEDHPGFEGLDVEVAKAIREAVLEEREACAVVADEEKRLSDVKAADCRMRAYEEASRYDARSAGAECIAGEIRSRSNP